MDWEAIFNLCVSLLLPIVLYVAITRWRQVRALLVGAKDIENDVVNGARRVVASKLRMLLASPAPEATSPCGNTAIAACGHPCAGRAGELLQDCMVCTDASCSRYQDKACPACLEAYAPEEEADRESLARLPCGCVVHLHCFLMQLHTRFSTRYISFAFLKCPSCLKYVFDPQQTFLSHFHLPFTSAIQHTLKSSNESKHTALNTSSSSSSSSSLSSVSPLHGMYVHNDLEFSLSVYGDLFRQVALEMERLIAEDFAVRGEDSEFFKQHTVCTTDDNVRASDARKLVFEFALEYLRFYLCSRCSTVYYGGTRDCRAEIEAAAAAEEQQERGDEEERGSSERKRESTKLLCQACVSQGPGQRRICVGDPATHQQAYVWKCRFCCKVATFFCLGQYHVCDGCHAQLDARINHGVKGQSESAYCPRNDISEEHPHGVGQCALGIDELHYNGPESRGERLLRCGLCSGSSSSSSSSSHQQPQQPDIIFGSLEGARFTGVARNLLFNPIGKSGYEGWVREGPGSSGWAIQWMDPDKTPHQSDSAFMTSDELIVKFQQVDLASMYHHSFLDTSPAIAVSEWYCSSWESPSFYVLNVKLLDAKQGVVAEFDSGKLTGAPEMWQQCEHVFRNYGTGVRSLVFAHGGKAQRVNTMNLGPRMTNATVQLVEE